MKPAWDQLMKEFEGHKTALVADVDCTTEGKELCSKYGVQGFPTIKYGSPFDLQDYHGQRDFEKLKDFAKEKLLPPCGPNNLDMCDEEKKAAIKGWLNMTKEELMAEIKKIKEEESSWGPDGWCNMNWYSNTITEEGGPLTEGLAACVAQCSKESECKSFSFAKGVACHRYDMACHISSVDEDNRFVTYNKIGDAKGDLSDYKRQRGEKSEEVEEKANAQKKVNDHRLGLIQAVQAHRAEL